MSCCGKQSGESIEEAKEAKQVEWEPPQKVEQLYGPIDESKQSGNRPTGGWRVEKPLEKGEAPLQLYSLATPNGKKAGILLEELGVPYDAHFTHIGQGDQFTSGFVGINPNSKIPALVDHDGPGGEPLSIMESGAIYLYLCDKYPEKDFLPKDARLRSECLQWLFWQVGGQGPVTGNFGHFWAFAPKDQGEARSYGISRFGMDVQRICDVLERHLAGYGDFRGGHEVRKEGPREYLVGDRYTVADMCCLPWALMVRPGSHYNAPGKPQVEDFLSVNKYVHLERWIDRLMERIQVQKGLRVCSGPGAKVKPWLEEGDELYGK